MALVRTLAAAVVLSVALPAIAEESAANPNFKRIFDSYTKFRAGYAIWRDHGYLK